MRITIIETYDPGELIRLSEFLQDYLQWVHNNLWNYGILNANKLTTFEDIESLPATYNLPKGAILIAKDENEIIGTVFLHPLEGKTAELKRLYIKPAYRNTGLGQGLLTLMAEKAVYRGYSTLKISTHSFMKEAISLYSGMGFSSCIPYHNDPLQGDVFMEVPVRRLLSWAEFNRV